MIATTEKRIGRPRKNRFAVNRDSAITRLRRCGAETWKPRDNIKLSDWCAEHVRLSELEASPGRYDLEANPFWRDVLDAMTDPLVRQISIKKSTQVGGTLLLIAATLGLSELDAAPSMIVGPDELYASEVKERTYAMAEESPRVAGNIPPSRLRNSRHIDLGTSRWYLAWAGSAQRLRGRACKRVFRSEIDVYPEETPKGGDPIKASSERVKRFVDSLIYDESSPDGDPSQIADLYDAGHQAQWYVQCPHCGKWQVLRFFTYKDGPREGNGGFGGLKDDDGNFRSIEDARRHAHYICTEGCKITNDEKNRMVRGGRWVALGQSISESGEVTGEPEKGRRHLSFHIWSVHSPTITLGDIVEAYLGHRRDGRLRDFFQNWLGLRYETRKKIPEWNTLGKRLAAGHARGTIPQESFFITAGCDIQLEGCYYVVRAWGDQMTSWLINWGFVQRYDTDDIDPDSMNADQLNQFFRSDIKQLEDAVINRYYPVIGGANPFGLNKLRPRMCFLDSQYRTREVHSFVATQDERRVMASRGDHKTKPSDRWRETEVDKPVRGGPAYIDTRPLVNIYTPHFKEAIFERFSRPMGPPGYFAFFRSVVEDSADYLRQLSNERPLDELDKKTGRKKTSWKPRSKQWGNHTWDCEVYAMCAAEFVLRKLDLDWDASKWQIPTQETNTENTAARTAAPMTVAVRPDQF